jgi:primosomal protein N'
MYELKEPFNVLMGQSMVADTAFAVRKMVRKIEDEMKDAEAERLKILNEFKVPLTKDNRYDIDGFLRKAKKQVGEDFLKKWEEMMSVELTIDVEPIKIGRFAGVKVQPNILIALEDFIVE